MSLNRNILLNSSEILSALLIVQDITTWQGVTKYIQQLPYGRNKNREDLSLVILERKGTCSSKHAMLKTIANENNIEKVKLIIGLYKMTEENTPGIGNHLQESGLDYIPEAHCYLMINGERADFTSPTAAISKIEKAILLETEIAPNQVTKWKVEFHKQFIRDWIISEAIEIDFDTIWEVREKCIMSLSGS